MSDHYHSALRRPIYAKPERGPVSINGNIALQHDVLSSDRLPDAYAECDVIYADLPWRSGLARFDARAQVAARDADEFAAHIGTIIEADTRPWVVTADKATLRVLPDADRILYPAHFATHGDYPIDVALYRTTLPDGLRDEWAILDRLALDFERVGDPFCGYGRTGRVFQSQGKKWTLSDYNAMCIGYIAASSPRWPAP